MAGRGNWKNWYEFLFSCIGCLVGLGNIWRFPYLCYKNGGGAFLVPYFIFMVLCAFPVFLLEMSYAQFSNLGPGKAWICVPLLRGVGYGMVLLTVIVAIYYNVIMAWTLYYFGMSFSPTLPWSHCDNPWNTDACYLRQNGNETYVNMTANETSVMTTYDVINTTMKVSERLVRKTATEEFWERNVLELTSGVDEPGYVRWPLFLSLLGAWTIVFLCLIKGIKSSGKVMYIAATLPYLLLTVLLIRGCTLDGAMDGFLFYAVPKWEKLASLTVWGDAAVQVFYSAGMGWGGISTLASYNNFHSDIERDAFILPILDCVTSWFSGCVIFVNLGFMAKTSGLAIDQVVSQGPGIAFMVYPEALAQLPIPQLWSVLFFLMLFTVGLDSQIVHVQTITSAIIDTYPHQFIKRKLLITLIVCVTLFLLGISCITQGGIYVLQILDWYCASIAVMFLALAEIIGIAWVYGTKRLYSDLELMLGRAPLTMWKPFWLVITPLIIIFVWSFNISNLTPVTYGDRVYPSWAIAVGWVVAFVSLTPVPVFMVRELSAAQGLTFMEKLRASVQPSPEWGPAGDSDSIREQYEKELTQQEMKNFL